MRTYLTKTSRLFKENDRYDRKVDNASYMLSKMPDIQGMVKNGKDIPYSQLQVIRRDLDDLEAALKVQYKREKAEGKWDPTEAGWEL